MNVLINKTKVKDPAQLEFAGIGTLSSKTHSAKWQGGIYSPSTNGLNTSFSTTSLNSSATLSSIPKWIKEVLSYNRSLIWAKTKEIKTQTINALLQQTSEDGGRVFIIDPDQIHAAECAKIAKMRCTRMAAQIIDIQSPSIKELRKWQQPSQEEKSRYLENKVFFLSPGLFLRDLEFQAFTLGNKDLILFDEVENGCNPEPHNYFIKLRRDISEIAPQARVSCLSSLPVDEIQMLRPLMRKLGVTHYVSVRSEMDSAPHQTASIHRFDSITWEAKKLLKEDLTKEIRFLFEKTTDLELLNNREYSHLTQCCPHLIQELKNSIVKMLPRTNPATHFAPKQVIPSAANFAECKNHINRLWTIRQLSENEKRIVGELASRLCSIQAICSQLDLLKSGDKQKRRDYILNVAEQIIKVNMHPNHAKVDWFEERLYTRASGSAVLRAFKIITQGTPLENLSSLGNIDALWQKIAANKKPENLTWKEALSAIMAEIKTILR